MIGGFAARSWRPALVASISWDVNRRRPTAMDTASAVTEKVKLSRDERAWFVTFNNPAAFNAIDAEMTFALDAALEKVRADESNLPLVLHGAGPAFMAGADLTWFQSLVNNQRWDELSTSLQVAQGIVLKIAEMSRIVIAAVQRRRRLWIRTGLRGRPGDCRHKSPLQTRSAFAGTDHGWRTTPIRCLDWSDTARRWNWCLRIVYHQCRDRAANGIGVAAGPRCRVGQRRDCGSGSGQQGSAIDPEQTANS